MLGKCWNLPLTCSKHTPLIQAFQKPVVSYKKFAVEANEWASPNHPSLSSRCGQSVGMLTKFDLMLHLTFVWSLFSTPEEVSKEPISRISLLMTIPLTDSLFSFVSSGQPSTWTYRKPWKVNDGSQISTPLPERMMESVCLAFRSGSVAISPSSKTRFRNGFVSNESISHYKGV